MSSPSSQLAIAVERSRQDKIRAGWPPQKNARALLRPSPRLRVASATQERLRKSRIRIRKRIKRKIRSRIRTPLLVWSFSYSSSCS